MILTTKPLIGTPTQCSSVRLVSLHGTLMPPCSNHKNFFPPNPVTRPWRHHHNLAKRWNNNSVFRQHEFVAIRSHCLRKPWSLSVKVIVVNSRLKVKQESFCFRSFGKEVFLSLEFGRVYATPAAAQFYGMLQVKHLMINNVFQD